MATPGVKVQDRCNQRPESAGPSGACRGQAAGVSCSACPRLYDYLILSFLLPRFRVRLAVIWQRGEPVKSIFSEDYTKFRRLLIEARTRAGLTQAELAAKLSRHQSYVSNYERGQRRVDVLEFLLITEALGVDPCELLAQIVAARRADGALDMKSDVVA